MLVGLWSFSLEDSKLAQFIAKVKLPNETIGILKINKIPGTWNLAKFESFMGKDLSIVLKINSWIGQQYL